jgi:hypothetical protein
VFVLDGLLAFPPHADTVRTSTDASAAKTGTLTDISWYADSRGRSSGTASEPR